MRLLMIVPLLFLAFGSGMSQEIGFAMTVTNVLPGSRPSGTFTIAAHPAATDGLDTELGEREIPSLPPPAGVFIIYTVPPTPDLLWLSPKDVRFLPTDAPIRHEYDLNMTWTGGRLELSLPRSLPSGIDSAYVVDAITDFPNNFIKARIDSGMVFTTDNPAITRLKVLVWYRGTTSSVHDDLQARIRLSPNPTSEHLFVKGCDAGSLIQMYSTLGVEEMSVRTNTTDTFLRVHDLPIGAYIVRVTHPSGAVTQHVMMHQ